MSAGTIEANGTTKSTATATVTASNSAGKALSGIRDRQESAIAQYRKMIVGLARGEFSVDPDKALSVCRQAGKTVEHFEADMTLAAARQKSVVDIAAAADLDPQADQQAKEVKASLDYFKKLQDDFEKQIDDARKELSRRSDVHRQTTSEQKRLKSLAYSQLQTTSDPALHLKIQELQAKIPEIKRGRERPDMVISYWTSWQAKSKREREGLECTFNEGDAEKAKLALDNIDKQVATAESELAALREQIMDPLAGMRWSV